MFSRGALLFFVCCSCAEAASILRGAAQEAVGHTNSISDASLMQAVSDNVIQQEDMKVREGITGFIDNAKAIALKVEEKAAQRPAASGDGQTNNWIRIFVQLIFGVIYYHLVVKVYPELPESKNSEAEELQAIGEIKATFQTSCPNIFLALCCTGPRHAHTMYTTGVMEYVQGLILSTFCPCCLVWWAHSFTDMKDRLGGTRKDHFMGLLCACCCTCCSVAQDAQTLDALTGAQTEVFGLSEPTK